MSIRLHQTKKIILTCHSDCATYGGLAFYKGDREAEAVHHWSELRRAAQLVHQTFPGIKVETYLINFEGFWEAAESGVQFPAAD